MKPGEKPASRSSFSFRRLTLLASVAGVGLAVFAATPDGRDILGVTHLSTPAQAAEAVTTRGPTSFADLVSKVRPAVIAVRVKIERTAEVSDTPSDSHGNAMNAQSGDPLQKFFDQFGFPGMQQGGPRGREIVMGEGSGFFISADGYAVTNNHVVDHAETVQIKTDDGHTYNAKVVGTDPKTDLALIKVEADRQFPFVKFSDKEPRIGDWVVAVGNPFGLSGTVTAGIISARGRAIGQSPYDDYIQIDAPINKGNSGGPAFDVNGNVIGVNTAIYSPSGGSVGIGFDIPAATAKAVVAQLKAHGRVERAWLGVQIQPVTADIADSLGMKAAKGALVDQPRPGSPAAKAGIQAGDVITAVDGKPVQDARDLARRIGMMPPDTKVKLEVLHKGESRTLAMTLGRMPGQQRQAAADTDQTAQGAETPHLGLVLAPADEVAGAGAKGLVVMGVDPNGPAAERGLQTGDVILDVSGKPVASIGDVRHALRQAHADGKHDVLLRVKTAQAIRFVAVPVGRA